RRGVLTAPVPAGSRTAAKRQRPLARLKRHESQTKEESLVRNSLRRIRSGRTRLAGLLFVAAILGVFAVSPAASAETAGPYHFTNRLGLLLAVNGGQMANGNKVVQWSNTGSLDQFWYADYANSD